jgi:hypothetical protein
MIKMDDLAINYYKMVIFQFTALNNGYSLNLFGCRIYPYARSCVFLKVMPEDILAINIYQPLQNRYPRIRAVSKLGEKIETQFLDSFWGEYYE